MSGPSHILLRKHSFLSSAAFGLSAIIITVILSGTVVVLYGVHLASEKSDRVIGLAQSAVKGLPEFQQALPPALADMLDDRRQPDYAGDLDITAKVTSLAERRRAELGLDPIKTYPVEDIKIILGGK